MYIDGLDKFGEGNGLELFVHKGADVFSISGPVRARCEGFPVNLYGHDGLSQVAWMRMSLEGCVVLSRVQGER